MKTLLLSLFACLNLFAGSIIKFPPGLTIVDKPIYVESSDTLIIGENSTLKLAAHANCPILVIGTRHDNFDNPVSNIKLKGVILDGNKDEQDSEYMTGALHLRNNCLTIRNTSNVYIENIVTFNARSGGVVIEKKCSSVIINGLNAYKNYFDGFAGYESNNCILKNALLHSNNAAGISLDWSYNNCGFENIKIEDNGDLAIFMRDCKFNVFKDISTRYTGIFLGSRDELNPATACFENIFLLRNTCHIQIDKYCADNKTNIFLLSKD